MFKEYIAYLKDNPNHLWFKRKLYGFGWTPATWQGWVVVVIGLAIAACGFYVAQTDDAPGAALLGVILMLALVSFFGYKKGEKPRWQWGIYKKN
jgi:drug/metabolite transporter (DMT)-like permease